MIQDDFGLLYFGLYYDIIMIFLWMILEDSGHLGLFWKILVDFIWLSLWMIFNDSWWFWMILQFILDLNG